MSKVFLTLSMEDVGDDGCSMRLGLRIGIEVVQMSDASMSVVEIWDLFASGFELCSKPCFHL